MENIQASELGVEQKSGSEVNQNEVEAYVNLEKSDEMPGSVDDQKDVETTTGQDTDTTVGTYGNPEITDPGVTYRCKRCRTLVATEGYVVTHKVGLGERCFLMRKRYHVDEKEPECTCLFVQPMKWMQPVVEGYISGKISCRKCNARLGQFHWAGMQCSCGAWVNPAFQLVKSKIDEC